MARMLCKALLQRPVLTREDFVKLIAGQIAEDRRRRIRTERPFSLEQFTPALQLAISEGLMVETEGGFRLTREGEELARHSRAGRTHTRGRIV